MPSESLCWFHTPGPQNFIKKVCNALIGRDSAWIEGAVSWDEEFRSTVKDELSTLDGEINVEFIDASILDESLDAAGLIQCYDDIVGRNYLPAMDLCEFLNKNKILNNTILWLYHVDRATDRKWIEFSKSLAKQTTTVKLVCEGTIISGSSKHIETFCQEQFLTLFDYLLFAMVLIQDASWGTDLKVYACRLAINMAGNRAEKIAQLLSRRSLLVSDPLCCAKEVDLCEDSVRLENAVRVAQLMSLLPKVELLRNAFVSKISDRLDGVLPYTDDYGNTVEKPQDLELRHIVYLDGCGKIVLDQEERQHLRFLHTIRNDLSHGKNVDGNTASLCLEYRA